jgi:hypothetical protein
MELIDATDLRLVYAPRGAAKTTPNDTPLWVLLWQVVNHGRTNITHGINCVCMDSYIREVKRHIERAMPPSPTDDNEMTPAWMEVYDAHRRINHVLNTAIRGV